MVDEDRILSRVEYDTNGGCWLWSGLAMPSGYGRIVVKGRDYLAHRMSWAVANGPIPDGLIIRHRCDVPSCVNPAHLALGTHADNVADMMRRGRWRQGVKRVSVKRMGDAISAMMRDGWSDRKIAAALGVNRQNVGYFRKTHQKDSQ